MNPYLKKIGVDSAEPGHFELLHIRSDEIDKDVIKAAAKKALLRLGADPEDESQGDWKTVRRQIKQAYQCLIDDQQRTAYIASLPRQNESHDDFSVTAAGEDSDDQDTESSLDTVTEELREEMLQEAARPPQPPPKPTGLALPMAEVVPDATGHAEEPLPMAKAPPPGPSGVSVNVNSGNSSPQRSGGLGRWLPLLLIAGLIGTAVAWGGYVWLQGQDNRGGEQGPDDSQPTPGQAGKDASPVSGSGEQETGAAKGDDIQDRTPAKQSTRQGAADSLIRNWRIWPTSRFWTNGPRLENSIQKRTGNPLIPNPVPKQPRPLTSKPPSWKTHSTGHPWIRRGPNGAIRPPRNNWNLPTTCTRHTWQCAVTIGTA